MASELEQQLAKLGHGDHVCPFHDNTAEQLAVIVPFLRIGLERGERCQAILSTVQIAELAEALDVAGVDVARDRARGALRFIDFDEMPYASGRLDIGEIMDYLRRAEAEALADGFTGLRSAGSADWMLMQNFDSGRLVEYEAAMNELVANSHTIIVCQYHRPRFDPAFVHDVLRAHPVAILGDLVCPNPYYEPPELMVDGDGESVLDFKRRRADWWIGRLKAVREAERRRERAETVVRERDEHIHLLLDSAAEAIYGQDLRGICTFANQSCARLLGYNDPAALVGRNMHEVMHHSHADGMPYPIEDCPLNRFLRRGESGHIDEETLWRADGTSFFAEIWIHPVRRAGEAIGAVVTFLDVSDRRSLEDRLRQTQKMEALGQLTGGIAHDFNNLLTVVLGNADMLAEETTLDPDLREQAEIIRSAAERGAELIDRMLAFARRQPLNPQTVDCNKLIRSVAGLLRRSLGGQIELKLDLTDHLWQCMIDPSQLETALLNLAVNARDAMPEGGKLIIGTANIRLDPTVGTAQLDAEPGDYVALGVTDTGTGMAPEVLKNAAQPFFTTKEVGRGTGLGLSMVYGFAKQSEGHMEIASEIGQGTTVTLYLPRAGRADARPDEKTQVSNLAGAGGGEAILLVEDDDLVRGYVETQLRALGYRVVPVSDGPSALSALRERPEVQLLFTDVNMPGGLNGPAVAEQAATIRPGIKVLFTSGYAENALLQRGRLPHGVRLLMKPYRPRELAAEVRRALDG